MKDTPMGWECLLVDHEANVFIAIPFKNPGCNESKKWHNLPQFKYYILKKIASIFQIVMVRKCDL